MNEQQRAEVLVQAIPYIQKFYNKTIVIKYGGHAMLNEELMASVMQDVVLLDLLGVRVVLVHGGGPFISDALAQIGHESTFVDGLRVTDDVTIEVCQEVLAGKVNKRLVNAVGKAGGRALGLCGLDGNLIRARQMSEELGYVGHIDQIDPRPVHDALDRGYIAVIASLAGSESGDIFNVNADHAAAAIAGAAHAEKLILMTDVRGVMEDFHHPETLISVIHKREIPQLEESGILAGGMIPKMNCVKEAMAHGVEACHIIDGTLPHAILLELLSDAGIGTMIV